MRIEREGSTQDRQRQAPPPERQPAPNTSGSRGGEGEGEPPAQQRAPEARSRGIGGSPLAENPRTPPADGDQVRDGNPPPQACMQTARGQEGGGKDRA